MRRVRLSAALILAVLVAGSVPVLAQGQDSSTSAQAPHTSSHPVPVLSTDSVTSVPSGKIIEGIALPAAMRPRTAIGYAPAGPVAIGEVTLDCEPIEDETARRTCRDRGRAGRRRHRAGTSTSRCAAIRSTAARVYDSGKYSPRPNDSTRFA